MAPEFQVAKACNKCGKSAPSYRLAVGGDIGLYLCRECWDAEMAWREQRNKSVIFAYRHYETAAWPGGH